MDLNPRTEKKLDDLWREIIAEERENLNHDLNRHKQHQIVVTYPRRNTDAAVPVKSSHKFDFFSSIFNSLYKSFKF